MRLVLVWIGVIAAKHCDITQYNQRYKFYGCELLRDGLDLPGDDGFSVFSSAVCRRAVCRDTKETVEMITCGEDGQFDSQLPPCGINDVMVEGEVDKTMGRLGTSGPSGSAHITAITQGQTQPSVYPEQVLIYGSFTPGSYDTNRLTVLGGYTKYRGQANRKLTGGKPIYKHDTEPDVYFSFYIGTMSWRITTRASISKVNAICVFKAMYGTLHDPTQFSSWNTRKCFIKGQWRDTDLIISDVSEKLRFRQRLCARSYRGILPNAHSGGQLKMNIEGSKFSEFFTLSRVLTESFGVYDEFDFQHDFDDILLAQAKFESSDALCLAELTIMKGTRAINLLQVPNSNGNRGKKTVKFMKWSHGFMLCWWDKNYFEDSAYPHGEVALVNQLNPNLLENLNHHYYKAVDSYREWTLPKSILPTPPVYTKPTKQPLHNFDSMIVTTGKTPTTTTTTPVVATTTGTQLHCSLDKLKQAGLRISNCKFSSAYKYLQPINSSSNQGLINGQVLNGAQCKMACTSFRKKPFQTPKMQCLCSSHQRAKFHIFASLKDIISQTNPLNFMKGQKQCQWYDRTKKNSSPVEPMSVFPRLQWGISSGAVA